MTSLLKELKRVFGYEAFREHQKDVVEQLLSGRDVFVVMPTGGGKSLCYQLPAHLLPGTCVVVSPLISLMKDQVDAASATGLRAACVNSTMDRRDQQDTIGRLQAGELDLLYVAPERLSLGSFRTQLAGSRINLLAIDEAHCISEWGHDFRPDYLALAEIVQSIPGVPTAAFTATATMRVQKDIVQRLGLRNPFRLRASFDRPNLFYAITPKGDVDQQALKYITERPEQPGIVYRATRKDVERTAGFLSENGILALGYHAGLEPEVRTRNQEAFRRDDVQAMVATVAFGMGIDKPNVRWVLHGDLPKNIESYYQETGRSGRDGDPAHCQLLFSVGDTGRIRHFIDQLPDPDERMRQSQMLHSMLNFAGTTACRRRALLRYFGEEREQEECGNCDVCCGQVRTVDATVDAQKVLSAIVRSGQRFGLQHIIDIVAGVNTKRMRATGHVDLPTYGVGRDKSRKHWGQVADELVAHGFTEATGGRFPTIALTDSGWDLLRGQRQMAMVEMSPAGRGTTEGDVSQYEPGLFEILRDWRKERAADLDVPPYVVFSDRTLRDISVRRPATEEQLGSVHGVGRKKLMDHGDKVLRLVAEYAEEHPQQDIIPLAAARTRRIPGGETCRRTLEIIEQGNSVAQTAEQRGLAQSTVVSHVEQLIRRGAISDPTSLLDPDLVARINDVFEEVGTKALAPVVERGHGAFGYVEARIVRAMRARGAEVDDADSECEDRVA